jgi:hypothetical protein
MGQATTVSCNFLYQVKHCVPANWLLIYWGTLVQLSCDFSFIKISLSLHNSIWIKQRKFAQNIENTGVCWTSKSDQNHSLTCSPCLICHSIWKRWSKDIREFHVTFLLGYSQESKLVLKRHWKISFNMTNQLPNFYLLLRVVYYPLYQYLSDFSKEISLVLYQSFLTRVVLLKIIT